MILKKLFPFIILLVVLSGFERIAMANELIPPRITASYSKLSDGTRRLSIAFSARENNNRVNITDARLRIMAQNGAGSTELGTVITNQQGKAFFDIEPETTLPRDPDGNFSFTILFEGNTRFDKASRSIQVTEVFLEISLTEKDTIKTITAQVFKRNAKGEKEAVPDVPVEFDVKRLFCLYPMGHEKTDSSGLCSTEFPSDMPGDKKGKVTIVVRIADDEMYGTVEESREISWGELLVYEAKPIRGLGDTDAPLWMVYTLLILLSGVWFHVIYVLITIFKINKIGKKAIKEGLI